ncbi:MAG TPA: hypothetical protein VEW28_09390 [Candidatus Kapabacteria bacterium]|nr:hypothetical protein [Candidatus Kapabacteria bacterium]
MRRSRLFLIIILSLAASDARTQQATAPLSICLNGGPSYGINESVNQTLGPAFHLSVLWLHGINQYISPEFGIGVANNSGSNPKGYSDYRTSMFPIDLRFRISPSATSVVSPFVYLGIGLVSWNSSLEAPNKAADGKPSGVALFFPLGGGITHRFNEHWSLELSAGWNPSLTDNLNDVHDGKSDGWWQAAVGVIYHFTKRDDDPDDDGLSNAEEHLYGTNPHDPDSDHDGLNDGDEVKVYHTNPLNPDTDGDGLSDGDEVHIYHTDPLKADTDGDGLSDYDEIKIYHTDPLNPDTDGDGLSDGDEVKKYRTDPLKKDTDGGGVSDGEEVRRGTNPLDPKDDYSTKHR